MTIYYSSHRIYNTYRPAFARILMVIEDVGSRSESCNDQNCGGHNRRSHLESQKEANASKVIADKVNM